MEPKCGGSTIYQSDPKNKVLIIRYFFPPIGGSAVQRTLKYVKYLPEFGWIPHVLTVKWINYYVYDRTLLNEVPPEAQIVRAESLDPLRLSALLMPLPRSKRKQDTVQNPYFTEGSRIIRLFRRIRDLLAFPDLHLGWIPFALWQGLRIVKKHRIEVIFTNARPVSDAIIAYLLSKITGLPYLLDFADGWTDDPYLVQPTALHAKGHAMLEKQIVGNAHAVTTYSEVLSRLLIDRYPQLAGRVDVLPNGFDPEDFASVIPLERKERRNRIVYMGSIYAHHEPIFSTFLEAIKLLPEDLRSKLDIVFVGRVSERVPALVSAARLDGLVTLTGFLSHDIALKYLASADAVLLFVRRGDFTMVTGKVFEYLMVERPILACIEPDGVCAQILKQAGQAEWIVPADNVDCIAQTIVKLANAGWRRPDAKSLSLFNRKHNTGRLAQRLDWLASGNRRRATNGKASN